MHNIVCRRCLSDQILSFNQLRISTWTGELEVSQYKMTLLITDDVYQTCHAAEKATHSMLQEPRSQESGAGRMVEPLRYLSYLYKYPIQPVRRPGASNYL